MPDATSTPSRPSPLTEMLQQRGIASAEPAHLHKTTHTSAAGPDRLLTLRKDLGRTWSRLSATQRLAQSLSTLPDNAGPLNSRQLLHRALTLMQGLSPDYLDRFISQVDGLLWLEQASGATAREGIPEAGQDGEKKPARSRPK